jgi:hypothetical protein
MTPIEPDVMAAALQRFGLERDRLRAAASEIRRG